MLDLALEQLLFSHDAGKEKENVAKEDSLYKILLTFSCFTIKLILQFLEAILLELLELSYLQEEHPFHPIVFVDFSSQQEFLQYSLALNLAFVFDQYWDQIFE